MGKPATRSGAAKKVVETKPDSELKEIVQKAEDKVECTICLGFPEEKGILKCEHQFCYTCIKSWSERENSCPLCKVRFTSIEKISQNVVGTKSKKKKRKNSVKVKSKSQSDDFMRHNVPFHFGLAMHQLFHHNPNPFHPFGPFHDMLHLYNGDDEEDEDDDDYNENVPDEDMLPPSMYQQFHHNFESDDDEDGDEDGFDGFMNRLDRVSGIHPRISRPYREPEIIDLTNDDDDEPVAVIQPSSSSSSSSSSSTSTSSRLSSVPSTNIHVIDDDVPSSSSSSRDGLVSLREVSRRLQAESNLQMQALLGVPVHLLNLPVLNHSSSSSQTQRRAPATPSQQRRERGRKRGRHADE